jgi:peptide/nickel transport system permease protein
VTDLRFTEVEFDDDGGRDRRLTPTVLYALSLLCLGALFGYDYTTTGPGLGLKQFDWVLAAGVAAVVAYGVVPLVRRPALARSLWDRARTHPRFLAGSSVVAGAFLVGLFGPLVVPEPTVTLRHGHQPPVFMTVPTNIINRCLGRVVADQCHGTWRYPLGTTSGGYDVLVWSVYGLRATTAVALLGGLVILAVGTLVGTVAGHVGGRTDELLMRYVDMQQVVPAFLVYLVLRLVTEGSLVVLVLVFGLLNWGGTARTVRSATRTVTQSGYVTAARAAGAGDWYTVRTHIVPNVAGAALIAAMGRTSALVLAEAGLAFLGFGPPGPHSLGRLAAIGLGGTQEGFRSFPWVSGIPVVIIAVIVLALELSGEQLQAVLGRTQ